IRGPVGPLLPRVCALEKRCLAAVEPPGAVVVVVQHVVVPADDRDCPSLVALQEKDHVAGRAGLMVVPVGHERVEDQVALRLSRLPFLVGVTQGVVSLMRAHARHLDRAIGAEGRDDVVGATVVHGLCVRRDGGPDSLDDLQVCRVHEKSMSTIDRSSGFTLTSRSAGSNLSYGRPARNPSMVRSRLARWPSARSDKRMYSKPFA